MAPGSRLYADCVPDRQSPASARPLVGLARGYDDPLHGAHRGEVLHGHGLRCRAGHAAVPSGDAAGAFHGCVVPVAEPRPSIDPDLACATPGLICRPAELGPQSSLPYSSIHRSISSIVFTSTGGCSICCSAEPLAKRSCFRPRCTCRRWQSSPRPGCVVVDHASRMAIRRAPAVRSARGNADRFGPRGIGGELSRDSRLGGRGRKGAVAGTDGRIVAAIRGDCQAPAALARPSRSGSARDDARIGTRSQHALLPVAAVHLRVLTTSAGTSS